LSLLLPSLDQIIVAAATFAVAAACVGLGQLVGARRPGVALVAGWGVGGLAILLGTAVAGMPFWITLSVVGALGLAGLVQVAQGAFEEESWLSTGRTLALAAPFLWLSFAVAPVGTEDFAQALPNLGYLYLHGHFPSVASPNVASLRPGVPYGMALIGLAASFLSFRLAENAGIVWNALLLVAFANLCGDVIATQIRLRRGADYLRNPITDGDAWGIAGIGVLVATMISPFFVPRLFLSNYGDGAVASVVGVITAATMLWVATEPRAAIETRLLLLAAIGLCCAALVNIRQDSLPLFTLVFVAAVATMPLERQMGRRVQPNLLLLLLPAPLLMALVWHEYQVVQIPDAAFSVLPFANWNWAALPSALWEMLLTAIVKPGHFGLLLVLLGVSLSTIDTPDLYTPLQRAGTAMGAVLGLGKTASLLLLYLVADYSEQQAASADEFWRFTVQVGPGLVAGGVSLIPTRIWDWPMTARGLRIAAPALAMLLPVAFVGILHADASRRTEVAYLRDVGADLADLTKGAASVTLVAPKDPSLDLAVLQPIRYDLLIGARSDSATPAPVVNLIAGIPPPREGGKVLDVGVPLADGLVLTRVLADGAPPRDGDLGVLPEHRRADYDKMMAAPFVWFADGGEAARVLANITLAPGASYLLAHNGTTMRVVRRWPFPAP
jgi:hypothetical protein